MTEHPTYLRVLPQFNLKPEQIPADLRLALYQKLGIEAPDLSAAKQEQSKPDLAEQIIKKTKEKKTDQERKKEAERKKK